MALMWRRKAFCVISRYRSCGRSSSSYATSSSSLPPPPSFSQSHSSMQLRPVMPMHSSLAAPPPSSISIDRKYTAPAFVAGTCTTKSVSSCFTHKCTSRCGCSCMTSGLSCSVRNCTTSTYPPPTPPGDFQGGEEEGEADGAPLNVDEAADSVLPPDGNEEFGMPPYDDPNDAEDDGDYVDEDPPPDPEEALLFSPSDSD